MSVVKNGIVDAVAERLWDPRAVVCERYVDMPGLVPGADHHLATATMEGLPRVAQQAKECLLELRLVSLYGADVAEAEQDMYIVHLQRGAAHVHHPADEALEVE